MKTKVIMYDHTGNNVINRHKELTPFAENIYTTFIHKDSCGIDTNDMFGIVFAIKGVYFLRSIAIATALPTVITKIVLSTFAGDGQTM